MNESLYTEKQEIPDVAFAIAKHIKNHPYVIAEPYLKEVMLKLQQCCKRGAIEIAGERTPLI